MDNVFIGCDHAGFALKQDIVKVLRGLSLTVKDLGCDCEETSVHYPLFAYQVVQAILATPGSRGILICGTGLGMSITANRFLGIRAALCQELYTARMSRLHNDANLLIMGGRIVGPGLAQEIVHVWFNTSFEGGRHQERLNLIETLPHHVKEHP